MFKRALAAIVGIALAIMATGASGAKKPIPTQISPGSTLI